MVPERDMGAATATRFTAARVIAAHEPSPDEPLEFHPGDPLRIGEESAEYPGWWRAAAADGRAGWAPETHVRIRGVHGSALLDYTARELPAAAGDTVGVIQELFGWAWCEATDGRIGWLPLEKLERPAYRLATTFLTRVSPPESSRTK